MTAGAASGPHIVRGRDLGAVRPRGWVRPGLTVRLAKYDRLYRGEDVGCYHVLRADGVTLCGWRADGPGWREAGWGDSEIICCKTCGKWLWRRWLRDRACDGVAMDAAHTLAPADDWVSRLDAAANAAPAAMLARPACEVMLTPRPAPASGRLAGPLTRN